MNREHSVSAIGEFDIMAWIESGTVAQRSVVIYNDPAIVAEFEALERRRVQAEASDDDGDEASIADSSELAEIRAAMESLQERWEASKAVWTVQALDDQKIRDLTEMHPAPKRPESVPDDSSDEVKAAHADAMRDWNERLIAARDERNLAFISAAIVRVETAQGTATAVPVEALRAMRSRPHGATRITQLLAAVENATAGDVEIPSGESHAPSRATKR